MSHYRQDQLDSRSTYWIATVFEFMKILISLAFFWHLAFAGRILQIHVCSSVRRPSETSVAWNPLIIFYVFWKILSLVFPRNNWKWKIIFLFIFHPLSSYRPKYSRPIKFQDSLKCNISRSKWTSLFFTYR